MNIEEIKRNLNRGAIINNPQPQETRLDKPVQRDIIKKEAPKQFNKPNLANDLYESSDDEEESKPQSEVWETEKENIDISQPIENIVETLDLEDKKYDWRYKTRKGRKSRNNFTELLKISL
jgi:hypothetical protein